MKNHTRKKHTLQGGLQGPKGQRGLRNLYRTGCILVVTVWFTGCQTLPRWESKNPWGLFPSDASLYLYLPVPEHRELLNTLLSRESSGSRGRVGASKGLSYIIDHTSATYLVLLAGDSKGSSPKSTFLRWILAGVGGYSSFLLRLSLTSEEGWEERRIRASGYSLSYYQHQESALQVALPDTRLLIVSSGEIEFPLRQFVLPQIDSSRYFLPPITIHSPGGFLSNANGAPVGSEEGVKGSPEGTKGAFHPISLYIPKTGISLLSSFLGSVLLQRDREFAVEAFRLSLYRMDSAYYSAEGEILFQKEEQARSMSVLVRLAFAGWFLQQETKGVPNSIRIQVKGTSIEFSGIPLSMETIAQFVHSMVDTIIRTTPW